ncbi:MAG TPA: Hsp20/alpha crystallin family protein [Steroidobacteraceae bacterium]|nr:Hsp20/alpha crystallin family protein [Steroidobacteraceae bacterium]
MNLVRWDPIREMDQFFARPLGSFMGQWPRFAADTDEGEPTWTPTLDVSETDSEYLVRADLPAVKREDVRVTVDNDAVTIAGERKFDKEENSERVHRRECFRGTFSRSLSLPENANTSGIRAESKDGVLTVHIPKTKAERSKAIEIKVQ